ncbi:sensor histidine kinase [Nocardioides renjunii]|uniref:sensor histidine kinase n=1 Tax=Nocardioides renjunii TaxID=3095075 RepID=UPI002AFE54CE|nr:HAMP domain-containing sensor histidine kinase [Nocardioides sp. S-34]WQQ21870.1 HAMP domain-containing sensor histidine kinase [Nocardioides sp. S-34]
MTEHPALQDTTVCGPVSPEAAALAGTILSGAISVDDGIGRIATHFLTEPRVEAVVAALTIFAPEDATGWVKLGGRAWVREWLRAEDDRSVLPPSGAGPDAALSMPWVSRHARAHGLAAVVDRSAIPEERDRVELERMRVRSLVATTFLSRGEMFGSMSVVSGDTGSWPQTLIDDLRLLNAALTSRIMLEQSRRALAEAIDAGAEAQLGYQHFFGSVGHELRTPLASVMGYTEVLLDDAEHGLAESVAAGMRRDGPVMLRACEQLLTIVDGLLGAGRALGSDDQRQDVSVADAVADVVHWHRNPAQAAGVSVDADIDPAATAWAHPSGVRQVLSNLLGNAIAHHRPTGGSVHLSTSSLLGESGRPMVRIIVRDDGPGLTPEQLQHAFEPFVRFAAPGTTGSGLGLSMSRTIAERDGGAVRGESTADTGSSFWVELPVRRS